MFMCVNLIEWKGVLLDYMKYLKYIGKVIIAGILALILLSVFSYVYSFPDYMYITSPEQQITSGCHISINQI